MIFNPLFLSENGNSQILAPKSSKLSNNKYLFSDIVKIVMNPSADNKAVEGNINNNLIGSNIGIAFNGDKIPSDIKLKFITDIEKENSEKGLTEILPEEIASLILNQGSQLNQEQVISYISQEPLKGELQGFINELVGKENLESYLNENSGLLIKLEDKKSTVNLELVKEQGANSNNNKVIVQTLVIPEKTKLFSILGHSISGSATNPLIADASGKGVSEFSNLGQSISSTNSKPQLSVYSFNYEGKTVELQANNLNLSDKSAFRLSLINSNSTQSLENEIQKVDLEKISFIPKDQKGNSVNTETTSEDKGKKNQAGELSSKIGEIKIAKQESDFNVNKITILKKQTTTENKLNKKNETSNLTRLDFLKNNSDSRKKLQVLSKEGLLKNLKYEKEIGTGKTETGKEVNKPNTANIKSENLFKKIKPENVINTKAVEKQVTADSKFDQLKVLAKENSKISGLSKIHAIAPENLKQTELSKADQKSVVNSNENKVKPNSEIKTENQQSNELKLKTDFNTVKSEKINIKESSKVVEDSKSEVKEAVKEESKPIDKPVKENTVRSENKVSNKIDSEAIKSEDSSKQSNEKSEAQSKVDTQKIFDKRTITDAEFKNLTNNPHKIEKENAQVEKKTSGASSEEKAQTNKDLPVGEIKEESKISVKVRNNLRSVSDKVDAENKMNSDSANDKKESSGDDAGFEKSNNSVLKNSSTINSHLNAKTFDNTLNHIINKAEGVIINNAVEKTAEVERNQDQKIVKSVEVMKEITQFISKQEKGSISFDIKPESLGKMKITLDTADNAIKARIDVDNEQARQLIERNIGKLQQELASNGIQLSSLNISLGYSRQQKEGNHIKNSKNTHSETQGQVGETIETDEEKRTLGYNTYEYIA